MVAVVEVFLEFMGYLIFEILIEKIIKVTFKLTGKAFAKFKHYFSFK